MILQSKEGIGYSNYQAIDLRNRPNFSKRALNLIQTKRLA